MHNLFFHCWMLVQRKAKVMLEYHETVIFLTENPQIIHWPNVVSLEHTLVKIITGMIYAFL